MTVPVAMIVAIGENNVIGADGAIPWRLPTDFAHFKRTTLGKPLIMGRKTFESIGKPLPGRTNIVVTRRQGYQPGGVEVVGSLGAALELAQLVATADEADEVICASPPEPFEAVSFWYQDFHQTSDDEVRDLLAGSRRDQERMQSGIPPSMRAEPRARGANG